MAMSPGLRWTALRLGVVEHWCFTLSTELGQQIEAIEGPSRSLRPELWYLYFFLPTPERRSERGEMSLLCREPIFGDHREVKSRYYVG